MDQFPDWSSQTPFCQLIYCLQVDINIIIITKDVIINISAKVITLLNSFENKILHYRISKIDINIWNISSTSKTIVDQPNSKVLVSGL